MTAPLAGALTAIADSLTAQADRFTELDAAAGDGDLGLTVTRIGDALRATAAELEEPSDDAGYRAALLAIGKSIAAKAPSTFGTLVASSLLAAASAMDPVPDGHSRMAAAAAAAADNVRRRGRSEVGERTLLDALVPASDALRAGGTLAEAADAAEEGAAATARMEPRHGRAAWIGERAMGVPDAGATVVAAFFRAAATA
jgi:phosphoenolpyruvate---glycerone phosphotransferase subunit DhaL